MRFLCVTPVLGVDDGLAQTIGSVHRQSILIGGGHSIEYVIRCKESGAKKEIGELIDRLGEVEGLTIRLTSAPDHGMYDALSSVWRVAQAADAYCYLGSGDYFSPHAFEIVADILGTFDIHWVTGLAVTYNSRHHLVEARLPYRYASSLIATGMYGRHLPCIQQESTFWTGSLMKHVDLDELSGFRYAGDFYLWRTFGQFANLYVVQAWLGGFEIRSGQLSRVHSREYMEELRGCAGRPDLRHRFGAAVDGLIRSSPQWLVRALTTRLLYFDDESGRYELK
jgi:hypothetical protein